MYRIFFKRDGRPSPDVKDEEEQTLKDRPSKVESGFQESKYKKERMFG